MVLALLLDFCMMYLVNINCNFIRFVKMTQHMLVTTRSTVESQKTCRYCLVYHFDRIQGADSLLYAHCEGDWYRAHVLRPCIHIHVVLPSAISCKQMLP